MKSQNSKIKVGDTVQAIVSVWREDENPSNDNFFTGQVKSIIRKGKGIVYLQIEKLDRPMPEDRCLKVA